MHQLKRRAHLYLRSKPPSAGAFRNRAMLLGLAAPETAFKGRFC